MDRIFAINSSSSGDASVSRILVEDTVQRLLAANSAAQMTLRDVGAHPVPHLTSATVAGVRGEATTQAEVAARSLSDDLIGERRAASVLVIGAPMYNFSIPSGLRTWFDHVLRPRVRFAYDANGPHGLISGVRAIVVLARGGV